MQYTMDKLAFGCCWQGSYWTSGFFLFMLKSSLGKLYGRHHDLVDRCWISMSQMITYMFHLTKALPGPFLVNNLYRNIVADELKIQHFVFALFCFALFCFCLFVFVCFCFVFIFLFFIFLLLCILLTNHTWCW